MFFVAKICKRALRASIEGYLAVAASTPTYSSLPTPVSQWVSESVIHSFRLEIASASPSFASLFYNKKGGLCTFGELSSFTVVHNNGWQSVTSNYRDKTNQGIYPQNPSLRKFLGLFCSSLFKIGRLLMT